MAWVSLRERAKPVAVATFAAGVVVWAVGATIFFRHPLLSSFDVVLGDRGDGRMIVYFHEHLFDVLRGRAQLTSPPFYYPQPNVLGFGPAFVLDLVPYSVLRVLGFDPFLSFQLVTMALSLACFLSTLTICARYLRARTSIACCAALLVTFPNNLFFKAGVGHTNFLLVYAIPCIAGIALWGIEDFPRVTPRSVVRVASAAALFALLFATDFYTAWMFAFTLLIAACAAGVLLRQRVVAVVHRYPRATGILLGTAATAFLVGLIPFALIYIPVRSMAPARMYPEYLLIAPTPVDLIDVSTENLAWGWLVERLLGDRGVERALAVTPGMTLLFLLLAYHQRKQKTGSGSWPTVFALVCVAVWIMSWLMTMKIGTVSGFWLVRQLVPSADRIRGGMRIQMLVNLWVVLGLAVLLEQWITAAPINHHRQRRLLASGVLLLCLIEQINLMNNGRLPRTQELLWLSHVPSPPALCRAFLVDVPNQPAGYLDQNDAMWISRQTGLPTLNGISAWTPPNWALASPSIDYREAARFWIAQTGLKEQVCVYDRAARRWSVFQ